MTVQSFPANIAYYLQAGPLSKIPVQVEAAEFPDDVATLVHIVQGLLVHVFWAERYGLHLTPARKEEVNLRSFAEKFPQLLKLDSASLSQPRPLEKRLVGNCRDFSTFLAALLKLKGVPARVRCGFGAYFMPGSYEDHWVTEYWYQSEQRWVMVDAQLNKFQCNELNIRFDPLNIPTYQFLVGGKAWLLCRTGQADPQKFGIFKMRGMGFIRGDLIRDFLALNLLEILPWDGFGLINKHDSQLTESDFILLDHLAGLTMQPDASFKEIRSISTLNPELRIPASWLPIEKG